MCSTDPITLLVTWFVPDRAIKGRSKKGLKDNQGWEKPIKKNKPPVFFNLTFCFFEKKQVVVLKKQHKNPILNCFCCIMQYHKFQNYTMITCYTYSIMAFKFGGQELYLIFVFGKCCWSITCKVAWQERAEQRKKIHSHTNSAVHVKFMYVPC